MKKLLFTAVSLDIGGIETSLINLLDNINYNKYKVTLILEKKEGVFLNKINKNVTVKELKVSNFKIKFIRKIINYLRKLKFKIFNKNKYDFSCCYATYSYSGNKLALIASKNSAIYIHNDYNNIYKDKKEYYNFFNSRGIDNFKYIVFVSNESRLSFVNHYPELESKTRVFNNFVDFDKIILLSKEQIKEKKPLKNKLFVYVGRLDEDAKKITRLINLTEKIKDIVVWVVGDGPDRNMYESLVNTKKISNRFIFLGKKKNPYPYINLADYIILTSNYEGFPVVYLESIVLKKKIITTIPVSDDQINIRDFAYIISKEEEKEVIEVKKILNAKDNEIKFNVSLKEIQEKRIKELEKIFDDEV